jgi:hypothetical protein
LTWVKGQPDKSSYDRADKGSPLTTAPFPPQESIIMRFVICRHLYLILLLLALSPAPGRAIPAITCHCFTERAYDPGRPTGADPYFLATTQNSFMAAAFAVEKKTIVIKKQAGAAADDLWIAYWLAARTGRDVEKLLQERKDKASWRQVATPLAIIDNAPGARVAAALKQNAPDEQLAMAVVDELLLRFRFHNEAELMQLQQAGASQQEKILAGLIAAKILQPATRIYTQVKAGKTSWGELLQRAQISPPEIQAKVTALVTANNPGADNFISN